MNRYFFDIVRHDQSELDYVGRLLPNPEDAYDAAELMALDLAVKHEGEMIGSDVTVSNANGHKLFSIPVKESYLTAMPAEWGVREPTIRRARAATGSFGAISRRVNLDEKTREMAA